ncbi:MAG TPA: MraY family glycosyltransferase [Candidatus Limnocylindrales bacterium]|jgi:UDP-GlcNAc:undecaprenyl-phosphate GlcNAc-1-phosphate transferase|nr:MraY family glycosyltransferase [Candidatus Limnocylindrales bacterium]
MIPTGLEALLFIAAAAAATLVLSYLLTPLAGRLAERSGAIDSPDDPRRVHDRPVPRGGGLAIALAFLVGAIGASAVNGASGIVPRLHSIQPAELGALFVGVAVAAALGFIDDRRDIRARWQLVAQIGLALLAVVSGATIDFINNPFGSGLIRFDEPVAILVTVVWIVGMINSINFIDGLDGLSTGVGLVAAVTLGVISLTSALNQPYVALLCLVLAAALAGFLPWNFHPARIFSGTAGVYALGYALAVLSILGTAKVALALLVLGVPILDTFWIIVRRLANRRSPFTPDRGHFHHRLLDLGLSHRQAVLLIYGLCGVLAMLSLVLTGRQQLSAFLAAILAFGVLLLFLGMRNRVSQELSAASYDDPERQR